MRNLKRFRILLFALACLITLVALGYAIENWRGQQAWNRCRAQLEARGEVLDWSAFIPAPVPDAQNAFEAPHMKEWFVRDWREAFNPAGLSSNASPFTRRAPETNATPAVVLLEVEVSLPGARLEPAPGTTTLIYSDPGLRESVDALLRQATGRSLLGPRNNLLCSKPARGAVPAHVILQADHPLTVKETKLCFSEDALLAGGSVRNQVQAQSQTTNGFQIVLGKGAMTTTDYLEASEESERDLAGLREALQRPYARLPGDYQQPFAGPTPNFVTIRNVALFLAQRAQAHLLLHQPEAALADLDLIRELGTLMEGKPAGKSILLVSAMVNVAVTGLYMDIVADGFRLHAWQPAQLEALQARLIRVDLLADLALAFRTERAATCRTLEITPPGELGRIFKRGSERDTWFQRLKDPRYMYCAIAPRGWLLQNTAFAAAAKQGVYASLDVTNKIVSPRKFDTVRGDGEGTGFGPYRYLAEQALPNYLKAEITVARNQTRANQAFVVCALERYRLAHGGYPEALAALVPEFAAQLPHDLIGGAPLKYARLEPQSFKLYSIGWDEKDDHGGKDDWVW
jgi:hypothetical protein